MGADEDAMAEEAAADEGYRDGRIEMLEELIEVFGSVLEVSKLNWYVGCDSRCSVEDKLDTWLREKLTQERTR